MRPLGLFLAAWQYVSLPLPESLVLEIIVPRRLSHYSRCSRYSSLPVGGFCVHRSGSNPNGCGRVKIPSPRRRPCSSLRCPERRTGCFGWPGPHSSSRPSSSSDLTLPPEVSASGSWSCSQCALETRGTGLRGLPAVSRAGPDSVDGDELRLRRQRQRRQPRGQPRRAGRRHARQRRAQARLHLRRRRLARDPARPRQERRRNER
jgi:hypothetical protein